MNARKISITNYTQLVKSIDFDVAYFKNRTLTQINLLLIWNCRN